MTDRVHTDASKLLLDLKREFSIGFHRHGSSEVPKMRVRISNHPPAPCDDVNLKDRTCTRPVFTELQKLVADSQPLRIYFDREDRHPWFDLGCTTVEGSMTFHVSTVHPVKELKSAV